MSAAPGASPAPLAQFQAFVYVTAFAAGLGTWGEPVDPDEIHPVPTAFILQHGEEHAEGCVRDRLGQTAVPGHAFHVQVLHADRTHLAVA